MEYVTPGSELVKCAWPALARRINYVKDLTKNFKKLTERIEDLCNVKDDLNGKINRARPFKEPSKECKAWIEKLEKIENQVSSVETEIGSTRRCLNIDCCFPDIFLRMKLGKRIVTLLDAAVELKEASAFRGEVLVDAPLSTVQKFSLPLIIEKESIEGNVQNLLTCIREEKNQKIGLWGMGGVGKTTVMTSFNNHPEMVAAFEVVIWVTVSKGWTVRKLQNQIADRMQIDIKERESEESIAGRLKIKLETMKFLLLLDDVWSQLDLLAIGIPSPNKELGSKIVMTSRSADVCKKMETNEDIKINVLSKDQAWSLFCEKVGEVVGSPEIEPIARKIVKECAGLPLAILVIGGSLRREVEIRVWKNFLDELRSASFECGDMDELVFKQLKFSYDRLKNDNVKNCFLYCALYPEDEEISVDELVELWRAEGFIDGMETLDKTYDKGHTIVNSLIKDSLLERCEGGVKMHDMVRDMALRLTSLNEAGLRFLVRVGRDIQKCPDIEEWEKAERICLMDTEICDLPSSPRCNLLSTLLVRTHWANRGQFLRNIPVMFFQHMRELRVLQLYQRWEGIRSLPSSVSSLVNLRGLYITSYFGSGELPSEIGELKRLEVLYASVDSLPLEIRQLTSLRSLRLEFASVHGMRTMFSQRVISSLLLLEDLRIYFSSDDLAGKCIGMVDLAVAEELASLKHLANLQFVFPTECLEHFLKQREKKKCPQLNDFLISVAVGGQILNSKGSPVHKQEMGKKLWWFSGEKASDGAILELLSQTYNLRIQDHKSAQNLSYFGNKNINKLKHCDVVCCLEMETIVDGSGSWRNAILPNLHKLDLWNLPKLRSISDDAPHVFSKLAMLSVAYCPKLRYVFTTVMIQHMPNLENLYISSCKTMEEIVVREEDVDKHDDDDAQVFFPKLKILTLLGNIKLVGIWKGVRQHWPSLEELTVTYCPNLKNLNLKVTDNPSALKTITGEKEWWEALEWDVDHDNHLLQPLFNYGNSFGLLFKSHSVFTAKSLLKKVG